MSPSAIAEPQTTDVVVDKKNGVSGEVKKDATVPAKSAVPEREEVIHMVDNRTGLYYKIPITHNSIPAVALKQIKAPEDPEHAADQKELGLRVYDPGYSNTAVSESKITYMFVFHEHTRSSANLSAFAEMAPKELSNIVDITSETSSTPRRIM